MLEESVDEPHVPPPLPSPSAASAPLAVAPVGLVLMSSPGVLLRAEGLAFGFPGREVFRGVSLSAGPGLAWVRGGDGRGKSTLLGLLAGRVQPQAGRVVTASPAAWPDATLTAHDECPGDRWLQALRVADAGWQPGLESALVQAFSLAPHLPKPLFQWSAGSRRKLSLVAAFAGGAAVTLLDTPYAALDLPSRQVLTELLLEASAHRSRAWIVADGELPPALARARLAAWVDLGD